MLQKGWLYMFPLLSSQYLHCRPTKTRAKPFTLDHFRPVFRLPDQHLQIRATPSRVARSQMLLFSPVNVPETESCSHLLAVSSSMIHRDADKSCMNINWLWIQYWKVSNVNGSDVRQAINGVWLALWPFACQEMSRYLQQSAEKLYFSNPFLLTLVARPQQMNRLERLDRRIHTIVW